jgi:hypothetical protein
VRYRASKLCNFRIFIWKSASVKSGATSGQTVHACGAEINDLSNETHALQSLESGMPAMVFLFNTLWVSHASQ